MDKKKYKSLIPATVLLLLSAWTFASFFIGGFSLAKGHYFGLAAALISFISFFAVRQYYKYVLGLTLLLGLFNVINFTPGESNVSLHFTSLKISFQPVSFFVCVLTVLLLLPKKSEVTVIKPNINQNLLADEIEKFKKLYESKSSKDLSEIIEDHRFSVAAKEAAGQLLTERQEKQGNT